MRFDGLIPGYQVDVNVNEKKTSSGIYWDFGRVVDGVNHGRRVLKGDGVYYKIFDRDYCRRENFIKALEVGFFDDIALGLESIIEDDGEIIGYVMEAGETIGSEFDNIPFHFYQQVLSLVDEKKCSFTI